MALLRLSVSASHSTAMGAKQSQQKTRTNELDISDIAASQHAPAAAASSTHAALSSASTSPALTSLSSKHNKLTQAWAPQQSRYVQHDKPGDEVTEWKADEEEKERDDGNDDDKQGSNAQNGFGGEDLFGKYKTAGTASGDAGGAVLGKRSGIVSGVKAASGVDRRQQPQRAAAAIGMTAVLEDDEGVDDSAVRKHDIARIVAG